MEEAINRFLLQMEKQEKKGFKDLASVLSLLSKPVQGSVRPISVADAIEAGFLPAVDEDQANMFTPSELRVYRHAQDHRLNWDIQGYPTRNIPGYTGIRWLLHMISHFIQVDSGRTQEYDRSFEAG